MKTTKTFSRITVTVDVEHDCPILMALGAGGPELLKAVFPEATDEQLKLIKVWFQHKPLTRLDDLYKDPTQ